MNILVFRYNISFIDPPLGGFGDSGNISPNPSRSGSINDKYCWLSIKAVVNRLNFLL